MEVTSNVGKVRKGRFIVINDLHDILKDDPMDDLCDMKIYLIPCIHNMEENEYDTLITYDKYIEKFFKCYAHYKYGHVIPAYYDASKDGWYVHNTNTIKIASDEQIVKHEEEKRKSMVDLSDFAKFIDDHMIEFGLVNFLLSVEITDGKISTLNVNGKDLLKK